MTSRDKASVLRRESLCQTCFYGKCSWERAFKPVKGWSAIPTVIADKYYPQSSYMVLSCPLYKARGRGWTEITVKELAKMLNICWSKTENYLVQNIDVIDEALAEKGYKLFFETDEQYKRKIKYYIARIDDAESDI